MTLEEIRAKAREKLKGSCGVYRECDGQFSRMCQGNSYGKPLGIGGVGSGSSFANNVKALAQISLRMKLIGPHFTPDTTTTLFGKPVSMPIYGAPVTGVNSFGGETAIPEQEFCRATVLGCKAAGTVGWRGDTYTYDEDTLYGIQAITEAQGWGIKICKPREQATIKQILKQAETAGAIAVGVDVDGCGSYAMNKHHKPVSRKSVEDLQELAESTSLPFIVKGIMCPEDAELARQAGAAAVVVSNHGGRVLDHTPGAADALPEIVQAVGGKISVFADGGIRTGYDVLKMLALGADAVLVGRDLVRAAVGAGIEGVKIQMHYLQTTLAKAMLMTGCPDLAAISRDILA
ncbi:alpha-hydroxy-acid oxidizing protein [candidate division KSB3 bacterium]|uniref:Alpha-hydroxy-acid oxidizing protein n=1 Tax=candidate division KSB3 bacterium TaxID=2044937 RepID=A0A9D5Q761_9BACT|nr:alpha-hydroxy-acid oxidizing protein [candidate division KSB3 bacterium]MBD3326579.1 alpha-hydroxy-acid oxidizing protein [candidate division KSB3 bacterium]